MGQTVAHALCQRSQRGGQIESFEKLNRFRIMTFFKFIQKYQEGEYVKFIKFS